jgi:iron complex outermembrane receptor protein/hemoglobin/transferrin/lactoferrin receptor protein
MKRFVLIFTFLAIQSSWLLASIINGKINDLNNSPVANAYVTVLNTPFETFSNSDGSFSIKNLPLNKEYTIKLSHIAYKTTYYTVGTKHDENRFEFSLEPGIIELNSEVIVTGNRFQSRKFLSPNSISTISTNELQEDMPRTSAEALENKGAWVQKTNQGGGSPFVRGLTGYHTLLMIDGIRLNNSTFRSGPNQYLSTLDPYIISNIELMRSSGSVQYGSDALGGVIYYTTKPAQFSSSKKFSIQPKVTAKYRSGGINGIHNNLTESISAGMERIVRAEAIVSNKNISFIGGLSLKDFGDIDAAKSIGTLSPTAYNEIDADAKINIKLNKQFVTIAFQQSTQNNVPLYHEIESGTYSTYTFDPQFRQLVYLRHERFSDNLFVRKLSTTIYSQLSDETRKKQKSEQAQYIVEEDNVRSVGLNFEFLSNPIPKWTFTSGVDVNYDLVKSKKQSQDEFGSIAYERGLYPNNSKAKSIAVFNLHEISFNKIIISLGARYSINQLVIPDSVFNEVNLTSTALVGNFGLSYKLGELFRLSSALSSGFRAPNINDVSSFGITDFRYEVPSPNLKPERSHTLEIGIREKSERISANLSIFQTWLTNLITNEPTTYNGEDSILHNITTGEYIKYYSKSNSNFAIIQGFEAETELQLNSSFFTYGKLYYTFGLDQSKNEPMRRMPPLNGVIGLKAVSKNKSWVRLEGAFAGKQDRLSSGDISDNRIEDGGTPSWYVYNLSFGYTNLKWLKIQGGINNITDVAYRIHGSGVDGYGRNIWLGIDMILNSKK